MLVRGNLAFMSMYLMTNSSFAPDFCRIFRERVHAGSIPANLTELSWDGFEVRICAQIPSVEAVYVVRVLRRMCPQGRVHAVIEEWPDIDVDDDQAGDDLGVGGPSAVKSVAGLHAADLVQSVLKELSPDTGEIVRARGGFLARKEDQASEKNRSASVF